MCLADFLPYTASLMDLISGEVYFSALNIRFTIKGGSEVYRVAVRAFSFRLPRQTPVRKLSSEYKTFWI